jgi:hypothetical protein
MTNRHNALVKHVGYELSLALLGVTQLFSWEEAQMLHKYQAWTLQDHATDFKGLVQKIKMAYCYN